MSDPTYEAKQLLLRTEKQVIQTIREADPQIADLWENLSPLKKVYFAFHAGLNFGCDNAEDDGISFVDPVKSLVDCPYCDKGRDANDGPYERRCEFCRGTGKRNATGGGIADPKETT